MDIAVVRQGRVGAVDIRGIHPRPGLYESGGIGEPLTDQVLIQTRLLLQLRNDVTSCHAHTDVHRHADTGEQGGLDTDDMMGHLWMGEGGG